VDEHDELGRRFEERRGRLRTLAGAVLGSAAEAEDAVQEAWLRLARTDVRAIEDLDAWLTTVVARIALDMLRGRARRRFREVPDAAELTDVPGGADPADRAVLAESVGAALLVVLDELSPEERIAFVLHDTFVVPFAEIGRLLDRSPQAAKQLAHRARRRVQGRAPVTSDPARQRPLVAAFLAASQRGQFEALVALLHPDVVLQADAVAVAMGSPAQLEGPAAVAGVFNGRALAAHAALVDGAAGIVWSVGGRPRVVWDFLVDGDRVVAIDMIADPEHLAALEITGAP
jgi:RNA polymerase sigma-70 factor (ECF subfamily)